MKNNSVVADIVANQRKLERKRWFVILSFLAIGVVSLILDVMTGPAMLSVSEVVNALFGIGEVDKMTDNIVHNLRLPMALMALVVGATLAVGGAEIQTLLNNPMASLIH
jgi:vitamin B12 transporter subunit: membrane component of ABC superfamily